MEEAKRTRRRHDPQLRRLVLQGCSAPGASVAQIALSHGLNANLVHKWRRRQEADAAAPAETTQAFVPVPLEAAPTQAEPTQAIQIELQRGALSVRVSWPADSAGACAAWLREILR